MAGAISGRVWLDADFDGQQDAAETQTASVTVSLIQNGGVIANAQTVNGVYTFNNVTANTTTHLKFNLPTGFTLGPTDSGADATDNDYDANSTFGATVAEADYVQVQDGKTTFVDAGIVQGANLTVFTWNDADGDGIQDAGAPEANGLSSVDVELRSVWPYSYAGVGKFSPANGVVTFNNVRPGNFTLTFTHPTLARTLKDQGGSDALDSDADVATGVTASFILAPGTTRTDVDAGFRSTTQPTGKISGKAWLDNGDGIRQTTENALTGVHVLELYRSNDPTVGNGDDTFVTSVATNALQEYQFTGLAAGNYYVKSVVPTNHIITLQNRGANDVIDSDFHPTTRNTELIVLAANAAVANVDVGFVGGTASIGNFIWHDADRDGIQDPTETGLAGAIVKLFDSTNNLVGNFITTTATGAYLFSGLQPGQYTVRVTPPLGYLPSPSDQGADDAKDSDLGVGTLSTKVIALAAGDSQMQWDAGFFLGAKVGDRVWVDTDRDGVQDSGEQGKPGVSVILRSVGPDGRSGTADDYDVAQTGTDSTGKYLFNGVNNGTYYVQFIAPTGFTFTNRDIGSDLTDSDAGLANGRTAKFTIADYGSNLTIDAGLIPLGTIFLDVGPDKDDNGLIEPGGFADLNVCIYDAGNGIVGDSDDRYVAKGKTNAAGEFEFARLRPSKYYVRIETPAGCKFSRPNQGANENNDSDIAHVCDDYGLSDLILVTSTVTTKITVGFVPLPGAIEGIVWNDVNRNRIRDGALLQGSQPDVILAIDISGSTSEHYAGSAIGDLNSDGVADTYLDAQILAGTSLINQLISAGYGAITRLGVVAYNGAAKAIDLNPKQSGIQSFVRIDANANGDAVLDVVEALRGLRSLGGCNYEAALQTVMTLSGSMGTPAGRNNLLFLAESGPTRGGDIVDELTWLRGKGFNLRGFGLGEWHESCACALHLIEPTAQNYREVDDFYASLQLNNSVGSASERGMPDVLVYLDLNSNGLWDANEPRTFTLEDDPDTSLDETGIYRFDNLAPGNYIVRESLPTGYAQTTPGEPGLGWLAKVVAGKTQRNADFGNAAPPTISALTTMNYRPRAAATVIAPAPVIVDADSPILAGGALSVRVTNGQSSDQLSILHQGTAAGQIGVSGASVTYGGILIGTWSGGTGNVALTINLNGNATLFAVQALAKRIAFRNTLAAPPTVTRNVAWTLNDGQNGTSTTTQSITIS